MRFYHIADTHLGASPDQGFPWSKERREELWESLRSLIQKADREAVDLLLIAGDLFHRQPLMRDLKELNYLFSTLKKTKVVFIVGNHDYLKPGSAYLEFAWNDNVTCLKEAECEHVVFEELDTEIYGLSYHSREITEAKYDGLEPEKEAGCSILLAHGGDAKHIPIDRKKLLLSGFDYIALGHIHRPEIIEENRMAYAGALEPIDQNDTGVHGFMEGEYKDGVLKVRFVPWAVREYVHLTLDAKDCPANLAFLDAVRQEIAARGSENIYRIELKGFRDPDIIYDVESCARLGNIVEVRDASVPDYDFVRLLHIHEGDIVGRYIKALYHEGMSETEEKALYYGIHALMEMRG